jgi:deazaflavin-dependent oxidoreductase (nitroreductase family)
MPEKARHYLRPGAVERVFGRILTALVRIGLVRSHFYILEVRGRKSGRTIALPVDALDLGGQRYLVCARGDSNWVRNVRAAGEVALVRALRRRRYAVRELPPDMRPPVLKAYLDRFAGEVQRFFPVPKGSAVEAFNDLAPHYPVFALQPLDGTTQGAGAALR